MRACCRILIECQTHIVDDLLVGGCETLVRTNSYPSAERPYPAPLTEGPAWSPEALNSLGDSGWELVYAYTNRDSVNYVFKPCVHEVTVDRR